MRNILLVEPDYRSKFPPLGLLRLSTYHKMKGDRVTFTRGLVEELKNLKWHKIYISSLFTYELRRTVKTIKFYLKSVQSPEDIIVGGIAATLLPDYIRENVKCRIITGALTQKGLIDNERKSISTYLPDYGIIDSDKWNYQPKNSYFCRITSGCIRKCKFCAVPTLEPDFSYAQPLSEQIKLVNKIFGQKKNLILLDNNILAYKNITGIIQEIIDAGFEKNSKFDGRYRSVDFNQGIDARLIDSRIAKLLSLICLSPIRLAFDFRGIEKPYIRAITSLSANGFAEFTNYVMFNFNDDPKDFYYRIRLNSELSAKLNVRITGFPMKYVPINDTTRKHVAPKWKWRYLRGIQCVLLATHGLVSPNITFFNAAFGDTKDEFLEIISMPDRYIIFRKKYENDGAEDWRKLFRKLSPSSKNEFLDILSIINITRDKKNIIGKYRKYFNLLQHYYPDGQAIECK